MKWKAGEGGKSSAATDWACHIGTRKVFFCEQLRVKFEGSSFRCGYTGGGS
jgi:hypothetical protein